MKHRSRRFTLLEVLVAMVILALGVSALLWQFTIALDRAGNNFRLWDQTHELTQAAEQLLLFGPDNALDPVDFSGDFQITATRRPLDLDGSSAALPEQLTLETVQLTLSKDGVEVDRLSLDCLTERR